MIKEFELVALIKDLPGTSLRAGDEGVVVMIYNAGEAYEVEFFSPDGKTIALETISAAQLQPVNHRALTH